MRPVVLVVWAAAAMGLTAVCAAPPAHADILVVIDKSTQRMSVSVDGHPRYLWRVSTGRPGYGTPNGTFHPQWMARTYFSRKYYDSPMPHSIFFRGGFAIHGTEALHRLGGPASHGCVRLDPHNAAILFALVKGQGMQRTRIVIGNTIALQAPQGWSARGRDEAQDGEQTQIASRQAAATTESQTANRSAPPAHIEIVRASSKPLSASPRIIHIEPPSPARSAPAGHASATQVR